jgi:hypothetical protein
VRSAFAVTAVSASLLLAGCGGTSDRLDLVTPGTDTALQLPADLSASICDASGPALEEIARKHPEIPVEQARELLAAACARGLQYAPTPDP